MCFFTLLIYSVLVYSLSCHYYHLNNDDIHHSLNHLSIIVSSDFSDIRWLKKIGIPSAIAGLAILFISCIVVIFAIPMTGPTGRCLH